ncbi:hypothetical protein PI125_g20313 [Phytophthora idaei]|nr:hypothetical protein PI125_g20313 [Phytophthora idaei]
MSGTTITEACFGLALPQLPDGLWSLVETMYPFMSVSELDVLTPVVTDVA